jgi:hypothetical protein
MEITVICRKTIRFEYNIVGGQGRLPTPLNRGQRRRLILRKESIMNKTSVKKKKPKKAKKKNWRKKTLYIGKDATTCPEAHIFDVKPKFYVEIRGCTNIFASRRDPNDILRDICDSYLNSLNIPLKPGELCKVTIEKIKAEKAKC